MTFTILGHSVATSQTHQIVMRYASVDINVSSTHGLMEVARNVIVAIFQTYYNWGTTTMNDIISSIFFVLVAILFAVWSLRDNNATKK